MPSIHIESTGHVYRNPAPNIWARQAYFPSVVNLGAGRLIVSFDMGSAMENVDVRPWLVRSEDEGITWSEPERFGGAPRVSYPYSLLARLGQLQAGTLIALILVCDRSRDKEGLASAETEGYVETQFAISLSHDEGRTWSDPHWVEAPVNWTAFEICSPIHEFMPGRWILPTSLWRNWAGECPDGMKAVAFLSDDAGKHWTHCAEVMNQWPERITSWEQKQIRLTDGRLLAVCWAYDYDAHKSLRNRYAFSTDDGVYFGPALESPLAGETCVPIALSDNRVLFIYRRVDKRGLWAHLARFVDDTWEPLAETPLWGAHTAAYALRSDNKVEEMSTLRFGYPQGVALSEDDVYVVFWCVEECVAGIRWVRIRLEGE